MTIVSDTDPDRGNRAAWPNDATRRMNRMYRWQRYFYDATRRYYLLGRDQLIAQLAPKAGATVLEVGCGTGRNLVHAAKRYPAASFYGIDVSTEMLTTATSSIARHRMTGRVRVAHGDATNFDASRLFGIAAFDHIMISYSLSMIPEWQAVLDHAVTRLAPGGRLHIVDFGNQERLPAVTRGVLLRWLAMFDVTPRRHLQAALDKVATRVGGELVFERPFRGYAQSAVLQLPAR